MARDQANLPRDITTACGPAPPTADAVVDLPLHHDAASRSFSVLMALVMLAGCSTLSHGGPVTVPAAANATTSSPSPVTQPSVVLPKHELDPVHTRVMFAIDHAGFSKAIGTVSGSTGTLYFDEANWQNARLEVTVPLSRLDLGDAAWNRATLAGNLLNVEKFPTARFVSTRIEPIAPGRASVHGTLTLHGQTGEIMLDVQLNASKRHPLPPFRRTLGFSASTRLSRKAFGIDAWPSVIGDAVELRIEAEAVRVRDDGDDAAPNTPEDPVDSSSSSSPTSTSAETAS